MPVFIKLKLDSEVARWRIFYVPALADVRRCLYEKWPHLKDDTDVKLFYTDEDGDKCLLNEDSLFDAWEVAKHRVEHLDRTPTLNLLVERVTPNKLHSVHSLSGLNLEGLPYVILPISHYNKLVDNSIKNDDNKVSSGITTPDSASDSGQTSCSSGSWLDVSAHPSDTSSHPPPPAAPAVSFSSTVTSSNSQSNNVTKRPRRVSSIILPSRITTTPFALPTQSSSPFASFSVATNGDGPFATTRSHSSTVPLPAPPSTKATESNKAIDLEATNEKSENSMAKENEVEMDVDKTVEEKLST